MQKSTLKSKQSTTGRAALRAHFGRFYRDGSRLKPKYIEGSLLLLTDTTIRFRTRLFEGEVAGTELTNTESVLTWKETPVRRITFKYYFKYAIQIFRFFASFFVRILKVWEWEISPPTDMKDTVVFDSVCYQFDGKYFIVWWPVSDSDAMYNHVE